METSRFHLSGISSNLSGSPEYIFLYLFGRIMKTPAAVLVLLLGSALSLCAQLTVPFTAKDGYEAASKQNKNFTDVTFKGSGIVSYKYDAGILTLNVGLNLGNGMSEVWGYLFTAKTPDGKDTSLLHLMYKPIIGEIAPLPIPVDVPLPEEFFQSANLGDTWLNSNAVVDRLKTNATFQDYRQKNPDSLYAQYSFVFNAPLEQQPQWMVTMTGEGYPSLACFVNAITGDVLCTGLPTGVREEMTASLRSGKVWPLPARDELYISIDNSSVGSGGTFTLYNEAGLKLREYPAVVALADSPAILSLEGLQNGLYLLRYNAAQTTLTFPVIISR